jgi:hypothetical protein
MGARSMSIGFLFVAALVIAAASSTRETRDAGRRAVQRLEPWLLLILVAFWQAVFWPWPWRG